MKCLMLRAVFVLGLFSASAVAETSMEECDQVSVSPPVQFRGKVLEELPDVKDPELRLANQLVSSGCFASAYNKVLAYLKADRLSTQGRFLLARIYWVAGATEDVMPLLGGVIYDDPNFVSAKVLLANLAYDQGDFAKVRELLDESEPLAPTDVWIYLNRVRLEARVEPSRALRARLLEMARIPRFPPGVRDAAVDAGLSLPLQTSQEEEEFMWARIEIKPSNYAGCSYLALARRLSEAGGRFEQARQLLESPDAIAGGCGQMPMARLLLAQAYLLQAAKVSPGPVPANEYLIDKALIQLEGDLDRLRVYVRGRPQEKTLKRFVVLPPPSEVPDSQGRTPVCNAVRTLDLEEARRLLFRGVDANGNCDDRSLMGTIMAMAGGDRDHNIRQQDILRVLKFRGAWPAESELARCQNAPGAHCERILLPVLEHDDLVPGWSYR